jgi:CheY-like chemotaxis protein
MHAVHAQSSSFEVPRNRRVLVVDDNPAIHEDLRKILVSDEPDAARLGALESELFGDAETPGRESFELTSAYTGQEAARLCREAKERGAPFAMAFVDVRMPPGWDGVKTIEELWRIDAALQVAICTAYSDYSWQSMRARLGEQDGLLVLKKPFDDIEVLQLASALTLKWEKALAVQQQMRELATSAGQKTLPADAETKHGHKISANVAENYLHICVKGRLEANVADVFLTELIGQARRLRPGFNVLNDLRETRPTSEAVADYIGAAQTALAELHAARVVRIVDSGGASALLQVSRKQREARVAYESIVVSSEEEAMRMLRKRP